MEQLFNHIMSLNNRFNGCMRELEAALKSVSTNQTEIWNRGGFAMLQLNPNPGHVPRLRFVEAKDAIKLDDQRAVEYGFFSTE